MDLKKKKKKKFTKTKKKLSLRRVIQSIHLPVCVSNLFCFIFKKKDAQGHGPFVPVCTNTRRLKNHRASNENFFLSTRKNDNRRLGCRQSTAVLSRIHQHLRFAESPSILLESYERWGPTRGDWMGTDCFCFWNGCKKDFIQERKCNGNWKAILNGHTE